MRGWGQPSRPPRVARAGESLPKLTCPAPSPVMIDPASSASSTPSSSSTPSETSPDRSGGSDSSAAEPDTAAPKASRATGVGSAAAGPHSAGRSARANDDFQLEHTYADLPAILFSRVAPTPVARPELVHLNRPLARTLGLDPELLASPEGVEFLAGNRVLPGTEPLAMAYAGHQFGNWVPQLGDGRAILVGEVVDETGTRRDVQLKGAGPTPYSRRGDGRSSIGPAVREYLGSEAMAALGVPTTRALAVLTTGEGVIREGTEPGGILVRVATSHVRVGTFEFLARRGETEALRQLADYVLERHYPERLDQERPVLGLLESVLDRTAKLVSRWLLVGFVHGVMNTDNTSIVGETIDYGPFGFLDPFRLDQVYSSIDWQGRYAFDRQPGIAHWNLARFAETLVPLLSETPEEGVEMARGVLDRFPERFQETFQDGLVAKIGLARREEGDVELALDFLDLMGREGADMTRTFRELAQLGTDDPATEVRVRSLFRSPSALEGWLERWKARLEKEERSESERTEAMKAVNPSFVLRNHLAEAAADAAVGELDFEPMRALLPILSRPFDDHPRDHAFIRPPEEEERVTRTFCGT